MVNCRLNHRAIMWGLLLSSIWTKSQPAKSLVNTILSPQFTHFGHETYDGISSRKNVATYKLKLTVRRKNLKVKKKTKSRPQKKKAPTFLQFDRILGLKTCHPPAQCNFDQVKDKSNATSVSGSQSGPSMKDWTVNLEAWPAVMLGLYPAHVTLLSTLEPGPVFWYSA